MEEDYVLAVYLDKCLLAGKCENEAHVGEHATAAFLFDTGVGVGKGQFDEVEVAGVGHASSSRSRASWGSLTSSSISISPPLLLPQGQPPRRIRHNSQLLMLLHPLPQIPRPFRKLPMHRKRNELHSSSSNDRELFDEIIPHPEYRTVVCARRDVRRWGKVCMLPGGMLRS